MINTSSEYKEKILKNRSLYGKVRIVLENGTVIDDIGNDKLMSDGITVEDAVSGSGIFEIGSAIINKCKITLNNSEGAFNEHDFDGAEIRPSIGLQLSSRIEWIRKGVFTVDESATAGMTIIISALDNMYKFDRVYSDSTLLYPATIGQIVRDACNVCGVQLGSTIFDNMDYVVQNRPLTEKITFREIISYAAQIAGCFARCNTDGALELKWYDFAVFENADYLDGGVFDKTVGESYQSGDYADGGNFTDYLSGDNIEGGNFIDMAAYHHIYALGSQGIAMDDIVITGIEVTASSEEDSTNKDGESFLFGAKGYVQKIEKNELVQKGCAGIVATHLGQKIVGSRFRKLTVSAVSDPSIEAGDVAYVSDRKNNFYQTVLTSVQYTIGGMQKFACEAESPQSKKSVRFTEATKTIVEARRAAKNELDNYELAVNQMNQLAANTLGFYFSEEKLDDGSTISYRHDKPLLKDSNLIYKTGIDGFFISTDGGKTYTFGFDKNGNAVMNILSVIGINADWIEVKDLKAFGATIADWKIQDNQISKVINLYSDMSSAGLSGVGEDAPVQYHVWMRAPVSNETWCFCCAYKIKSDYLAGNTSVYGRFYARTDGYVSCNDLHMTGGSLNINTGGTVTDSIILNSTNSRLRLSSSWTYWESQYGVIDIQRGMVQADAGGRFGKSGGTYALWANQSSVNVNGDFTVHGGNKSRVVETPDFGQVKQYAYETASPYFGDIGSGQTDSTGLCYIFFDRMFAETVSTHDDYQVFLQTEGEGTLWIAEKTEEYFAVKGTADLKFAWESKVKQRDYEHVRMEIFEQEETLPDADHEILADNYLENYERELMENEEIN